MPETNRNVGPEPSHEPHRILKPDLFMTVALWMEISPLAERPINYRPPNGLPIPLNKSGAVYVLPNDRALSVDCSKNGVHAAVAALNKFGQERAKGCQVYLSRRPCSFCAKLLVQCGVSKVFYLPFEPELNDQEDARRVDSIFLSSNVGLSIKVPKIDEAIFQDRRQSPYRGRSPQPSAEEDRFLNQRLNMRDYWNDNWVLNASAALRWEAFDDLKEQITEDISTLLRWIAHTTVLDVPRGIRFAEIVADLRYKDDKMATEHDSASDGSQLSLPQQESIDAPGSTDGCPNPRDDKWQKLALHMSRLAQMLSQRSDDPIKGVGCVLMFHNEIVAIGWNGFPAKALYGEFPRAPDTDEARDRKEPYVIHAEQNALLTRTKRNMRDDESSVLFINEVPCQQCIPLLLQAGVTNLVIPKITATPRASDVVQDPPSDAQINLQYALKKGIKCYGSTEHQQPVPVPQSSRNLRDIQ